MKTTTSAAITAASELGCLYLCLSIYPPPPSVSLSLSVSQTHLLMLEPLHKGGGQMVELMSQVSNAEEHFRLRNDRDRKAPYTFFFDRWTKGLEVYHQ